MSNHDPIYVFLHFLTFLIHPFLINYFYLRFLTPYHKKKAIIYGTLLFSINIIIVTFFIYDNNLLRSVTTLLSFEIIALMLYQDSIGRKLSAGVLMLFFDSIGDILAEFVLIFFLGNTDMYQLPYPIFLFILLFANLIIYIFIRLFLQIFNNSPALSKNYHKLFTALSVFLCLLTLALLYSFIFNKFISLSSFTLSSHSILLMLLLYFICCLICLIYIYKSITSLHKSITHQLIIKSLHDLYLSQIHDLIDLKNNSQQINYLRHDIMNYLQTIEAYNQSKQKESPYEHQ